MAAARLRCGRLSTYDEASFVPAVGEVVPCRRHGFCEVASREKRLARVHDCRQRPARRTTDDLVAFLSSRGHSTVSVLRRDRFTLRVVMAAHADGVVDVDLTVGRVELRKAQPVSLAG